MVEVLRTPEERFSGLPDWRHEPVYAQVVVDGVELRVARVEVGPEDGHRVVLLHGEPTWGFLWRHVVPPLVDAGLRVVVPDHPGFGRSDKPAGRDWYSHARLDDALAQHLDVALGGEPCTLVVHDWGGLLGLVWAARNPDRVARLVVTDTGLYRSGGRMSEAWLRFRNHVERLDAFPVADMVDGACLTDLADDVRGAYEAPFPDPSFHGGPLALPLLVPTSDDSAGADTHLAAWQVLESWTTPTAFVWASDDPIIPPAVGERISQLIPGTRSFDTVRASHFLQEDAGRELGERIAAFVADVPVG